MSRVALLLVATTLGSAALFTAPDARAGAAPSPAEIAAGRQGMLDDMLAKDPPYAIADIRWVCAMGGSSASVAEHRKEGAYFFPDAVDSCSTALVRSARDHVLPELYSRLVTELGGSAAGSDRLPRVIGATVLGGGAKVAIGNGKVAGVTAALAFDAGFTVGYQGGAATKTGAADAQQLRTVAAACLEQRQDPATCFSVGYEYGAGAFKAQTAAAR